MYIKIQTKYHRFLLIALLMGLLLIPSYTLGASSASFQLYTAPGNAVSGQGSNGSNSSNSNQATWYEQPATSASFKINPIKTTASVTTPPSTPSGGSGDGGGGEGNGARAETLERRQQEAGIGGTDDNTHAAAPDEGSGAVVTLPTETPDDTTPAQTPTEQPNQTSTSDQPTVPPVDDAQTDTQNQTDDTDADDGTASSRHSVEQSGSGDLLTQCPQSRRFWLTKNTCHCPVAQPTYQQSSILTLLLLVLVLFVQLLLVQRYRVLLHRAREEQKKRV